MSQGGQQKRPAPLPLKANGKRSASKDAKVASKESPSSKRPKAAVAEEDSPYDTDEAFERYKAGCLSTAEAGTKLEASIKMGKAARGDINATAHAVEGGKGGEDESEDEDGGERKETPKKMKKKMTREETVQLYAPYRIDGSADYGCLSCGKVYKACAAKFQDHVAQCQQLPPSSQKQVCPPAHTPTRCTYYV